MLSFREGTAPSDPASADSCSNRGLKTVTWTSRAWRTQEKDESVLQIGELLEECSTEKMLLFFKSTQKGNFINVAQDKFIPST